LVHEPEAIETVMIGESTSRENAMTTKTALPESLYAAHQWISAAGEWDDAVAEPEKYAAEAAANAVENNERDVSESDLLDVIAWYKSQPA